MTDVTRAELRITGRVQGVCYRASTVEAARRIGLAGWVQNELDGSVTALAEGSRADVERLIAWCWQGPPSAHVDGVAVRWGTASGEHAGFRVRR